MAFRQVIGWPKGYEKDECSSQNFRGKKSVAVDLVAGTSVLSWCQSHFDWEKKQLVLKLRENDIILLRSFFNNYACVDTILSDKLRKSCISVFLGHRWSENWL